MGVGWGWEFLKEGLEHPVRGVGVPEAEIRTSCALGVILVLIWWKARKLSGLEGGDKWIEGERKSEKERGKKDRQIDR